ncbi:AraC family transcriptional regulator [Variovorax sp. J31P207]|uniref:AraC family transcriptional regulator n=1 Tax=Variovorax sp. J31P207 TaxID=3053510 RepID=UPI002577BDFE|nr:AraC family transcriptional regulator [Variovorax sp. J31P207]MDM0068382.1 AraC family transcriptional regulator ligand-binding domain-containing protein [Variovorax sp. J31P207]
MTAYLRGWVLRGIADLINKLGGDAHLYEVRFKLPLHRADVGELNIPAAPLIRLLEACAEDLDCADFGIRLGLAQGRDPIGPIAAGIQAGTLGEAIEAAVPYINMLNPALALELQRTSNGPRLAYLTQVPRPGMARQFEEWCLAINLQVIRHLVGNNVRFRGVYFSHAPLLAADFYARVFGCPVRFSQGSFGVDYFAGDMARATREHNTEMKAIAADYIGKIAEPSQLAFEEQMDAWIRKLLPQGRCQLEAIAQEHCVSVRTLQRRLEEKGLVFEKLVDDVRREHAALYLGDRVLRMSQVAALLGYVEQSSFSHAFKRWYGTTPSAWRKAR